MIAQIYKKERQKFLTTFIPEERPYYYEFYLGEFNTWIPVKNTSEEFISLGGSKENPLIYKYKGPTDFTFNITGPNFVEQRNTPGLEIFTTGNSAYYELWIDGVKPYYFNFGLQNENIFNRTVSIIANPGQTTKFKFRLTINFLYYEPDLKHYYFEGREDTIYSSITAKYIPDTYENKLEKSQPIIIKEDTTIKKNRRYLVYALYGKILQLNLDEEDEFEVSDWIEIKNMEFGHFRLNSMKYDIVMKGKSSRAKNGYIQSTLRGDFIRLECLEKNANRIILSDTNTVGNFTIL